MSVMPGKRRRTARSVTTNRLPVDQHSSGSTWCSKPTTFVLLRPCCLTLVGLLLSMLLREVPADHAATERPDYRVVPSIVTGHSAHDRIPGAACGVRSDFAVTYARKTSLTSRSLCGWKQSFPQRLFWRILVEQLVVL